MTRHEILFTQRPMTAESGYVTQNINTETGQGEVYKQMGALGAEIGGIGEKTLEMEGQTQTTNYMLDTNDEFEKLQIALMDEKDPEKFQTRYEEYWKERQDALADVKSVLAQRSIKKALPVLYRQQQSQITEARFKKADEDQKWTSARVIALYIDGKLPRSVAVEQLKGERGIKQNEIDARMIIADNAREAKVHADTQEALAGFAYTNPEEVLKWEDPDDMRAQKTGEWPFSQTPFVNATNKDFPWIRGLAKDGIKQTQADKAMKAIAAQRKAINTMTNKMADPISNGQLLDIEFETLKNDLSKDKQEIWQEIYDHRTDKPANETNHAEFNRLQGRILDFWNKEPNSDIADLQTALAYSYKGKTKHLTEDDYRLMLSMLNTKINPETLKSYRAVFDKAGRLISDDKYRAGFNSGLFDYINRNPDATYKEIESLLDASKERMAVAYVEKVVSQMKWPEVGYGRWYPLPPNPYVGKGVPPRSEKEIDITKPPSIEFELWWKQKGRLSDEAKTKIWQYWHGGYTPTQIIEALKPKREAQETK